MTQRDFTPEALNATLEVAYKEGRQVSADMSYKSLIAVEETSSNAKKVVFYGDRISLKRLRGERKAQQEFEYSTNMQLDEWEASREYKNTDLDDDRSGFMTKKATTFGQVVETSLESETYESLRSGTSLKCFDGANLFDFSHAYVDTNGVTQNAGYAYANINLGNLGVSTNTIKQLQFHFGNLKSDKNKPLGARLTDIVVRRGSDNAHAAKEIANSTLTVDNATNSRGVNTLSGSFNIIEVDYGLGVSEWIGLDLSSEDRPLTLLKHTKSPGPDNMMLEVLGEGSEQYYWNKKINFGVYGRFDWNMGDPRTCYLFGSSTFSASVDDLEAQRVGDPNQS